MVSFRMNMQQRHTLLARYSAGEITAIDLRRQFDGATYGDVFRMLADEGLSLPQAPIEGREEKLARAQSWLFPKQGHGR